MCSSLKKPVAARNYELTLFAQAVNWKRYWSKLISKYLNGAVAEVGAGIGTNAPFFLIEDVKELVLIEPDEQLFSLLNAPKYPEHVRCVQGTLEASCRDFDTIVYIDVLEHIEDDSLETSRAYERLTKGGHLVILSPAWPFLYSPFDEAVGHYRRYTRASLRASVDSRLETISERYLDSVGLLASLANKLFLRASAPSDTQISVWDRVMVRASRALDPFFLHTVGKTIVGIYRKP